MKVIHMKLGWVCLKGYQFMAYTVFVSVDGLVKGGLKRGHESAEAIQLDSKHAQKWVDQLRNL